MASIEKCNRKYGICYVIRLNITNPNTKQKIRRCMTWRVPSGMKSIDAEKEALRISLEFEKENKELNYIDFDYSKIRINEYSNRYLEFIKKNHSISHYVRTKQLLEYMNSKIGDLFMVKLNPHIVQSYFDVIDNEKMVVKHIVPKKDFKKILDGHYTYTILRRKMNVQHSTLSKAYKGLYVSEEWANDLCGKTNLSFDKLFIIKKEIKEYSFRTKHQRKIVLRQLLAHAKRERIIKENYALASCVFYTKNKEKQELKIMNKVESLKLYNELLNCENLRIKTALLLFLFTGLRRGEAAGLKWSDVDIKNNKISIRRNILYFPGFGVIEKEPKTKGSIRTITIPSQLCEVLNEYKTKYCKKDNTENWLFTRKNGDVISGQTFIIWLRRILKKAKLPNYTLHSLRHTNITLQLLNGVPVTIVSQRAGHSTPSTTYNFYSHYLTGEDGIAVEALDNIFKKKENS